MTTYIQTIQSSRGYSYTTEIEAINQGAAEEAAAAIAAEWDTHLDTQEAEAEATRRNFVPWSNLTADDRFQLVLNTAEQLLRSCLFEGGPWQWGNELPAAEELPEAVSTYLSQGYHADNSLDYILEEALFWVNASFDDLEEFGQRPDFFNPEWPRRH